MVLRLEHHRYAAVWYQVDQWCAHVEFVVLNLAFSIVLGMLWFNTVGLHIDWSNGTVVY